MIKNISVLGAGTMGHGIANVFAMNGYKVNLYENYEPIRNSALEKIKSELEFMVNEGYIPESKISDVLSNITIFSDLAEAVKEADYVIEATPEILDLKQNLFKQLDELCPQKTIFASNTSSLPLKDLMALLTDERKARTMICHWYNPAHLLPIAELSYFGNMSDDVFNEVYELYCNSGKKPVKVLKDIPGLIANRMLHALAREVFTLIEMGAASPEDIDNALKFGPGFRSATTGMLEVADMGGLDIWCTVEDGLFKELNNSDKACDMLRAKVKEGKLGLKTGEGFYKYSDDLKGKVQAEFYKRLITQLKASKNY
jgi:3-hydroxybutyryl-CoA dehydrogenase